MNSQNYIDVSATTAAFFELSSSLCTVGSPTARKPAQDCAHKTARTRLHAQDCMHKTARTRLRAQDCMHILCDFSSQLCAQRTDSSKEAAITAEMSI